MSEHRHGYSCEQAEREIDAQMAAKLEAQQCLRLICGAIDLPLDELADGWKASLPIILARLEMIVDEAERGFRERDDLRFALLNLRETVDLYVSDDVGMPELGDAMDKAYAALYPAKAATS